MDNIQAAMLLPQMKRIREKAALRQKLAALYEDKLSKISGIRLLSLHKHTTHAWHLFAVLVDVSIRDKLIIELNKIGVSVMVNYRAIHLLSYFAEKYGYKNGDFPVAEAMGQSILSLPFYPTMPEESALYITETLNNCLNDNSLA